VIKRNGQEVPFEIDKIANAIRKANKEVDRIHQLNEYQIAIEATVRNFKAAAASLCALAPAEETEKE
jgi:anaerobic ribonucleoside-triphosphate reductase